VVEHVDALAVGLAAWRLGAGRAQRGHPVSAGAGVILRSVPGDQVAEGQVVAELHADDEARLESGRAALAGAFRVGEGPPRVGPRVLERVEAR
jgi:thymidine phosphorylase